MGLEPDSPKNSPPKSIGKAGRHAVNMSGLKLQKDLDSVKGSVRSDPDYIDLAIYGLSSKDCQ